MKIAIPMDNDKICPHFGRSPYFLIVEIGNSNEIVGTKILNNTPCDGQGHGKSIEIILSERPDVVLCINMGTNSIQNLTKNGLEIYKCNSDDVDYCIKQYLDGNLEKIN